MRNKGLALTAYSLVICVVAVLVLAGASAGEVSRKGLGSGTLMVMPRIRAVMGMMGLYMGLHLSMA